MYGIVVAVVVLEDKVLQLLQVEAQEAPKK